MTVSLGLPPVDIESAGERFGPVRPLAFTTLTFPASKLMFAGSAKLIGWSIIEPTGATPATFEIYDGLDISGELCAVANVAAGGSVPQSIGSDGVQVHDGLFINMIAGNIRGALWVRLWRGE